MYKIKFRDNLTKIANLEDIPREIVITETINISPFMDWARWAIGKSIKYKLGSGGMNLEVQKLKA